MSRYLLSLDDDISACRKGGQPTGYWGERGDWWEAANILHCPSDLIY